MSHRYMVREIAQQAGLSDATVDRVLHNRPMCASPEQSAAGIGRIQRHRDEMSRSTQGATCSPVDPSHGPSKDR